MACVVLAGCWTSSPASAPEPARRPRGSCPARVVGSVHDLDRDGQPIDGATVVLSTIDGRVDSGVTDATGRFVLVAVAEPAKLTIYYRELVVEHLVATCQPALRIGVHTKS